MYTFILLFAGIFISYVTIVKEPDLTGGNSGDPSGFPIRPVTPLIPSLFSKVFFPTDLSEMSNAMITSIARLPGIRALVLVHYLNDPDTSAYEEATRSIQLQQEIVKRLGIDTQAKVIGFRNISIPEAILTTAGTENASLIVVGARKGLLSGSLLGPGAGHILTNSRTHVLIMKFDSHGLFQRKMPYDPERSISSKIIFPTDFSKPAREALEVLKQSGGVSEVVLLHVIRPLETDGKAQKRTLCVVNERLRRWQDELGDAGIHATTLVRYGKPCEEICQAAVDENASMIMMSRYGWMDYIRQVPLGTTTAHVAKTAKRPVLVVFSEIHVTVHARELQKDEFFFAEKIWLDYHQTKSDPDNDRIFGVFVEDTPVSVARCKRHTDGFEVDGVFTWDEFRGRGYARKALEALIDGCRQETLYMHATLPLVNMYSSLGFVPIPEKELPPTIRSRYAWAMGEMKGANVCPMKRKAH